MIRPKTIIILLAILIGLAIWAPRQMRLNETRVKLAQIKFQLDEIVQKQTEARNHMASLQISLKHSQQSAESLKNKLTQAQNTLDKIHPESLWAEPPAQWPDWNTNSPYVWIQKSTLNNLYLSPFSKNGKLSSSAAEILDIPKNELDSMNEKLHDLVKQSHQYQSDRTEIVPEESSKDKITLKIDSLGDEGKRLENEFKNTLNMTMGEQRADLLLQQDSYRISDIFHAMGEKISVGFTTDNMIEIDIRNRFENPKTHEIIEDGGGSHSVLPNHDFWVTMLQQGIPTYLFSHFEPLTDEPVPDTEVFRSLSD